MQQVLKQSTAATTIVGPILDSAGAVYAGAAIADLNITKNGTTAAMAAAATLTHDHNGHYILVFTTGNTDTLGRLDVTCNKATYAMPAKVFEVLSANIFDSLVSATDKLDINVEEWNATAVPAEHTAGYPIVTIKDGTGTGEIDTASGTVTVGTNNDKTGYALTQAFPTNFSSLVITAGGTVNADMVAVSTDTVAADNFETMLDGTGGKNLTLARWLVNNSAGAGDAVAFTGGTNGAGMSMLGTGNGPGFYSEGGTTSGGGMRLVGGTPNGSGLVCIAVGSGSQILATINGNLSGNVTGSVNSVTNDVGITQAGADRVWATTTRTLSAFSFAVDLSAAGVSAVWDKLLSGITTASSIGKLIKDNLDAAISSRLSAAGYTAPDNAGITTILNRLGAFTGSGVNTILGFFKALLSKVASTPSDVGGTFDPTTDSTEAIRDRGDFAWITGSGGGGGGGGFVGARSVTLNFKDGGGALVPGVAFTVFAGASTVGSALAGTGSTTVGLDDGSYTLVASPQNNVVFPSTPITVSGDGTFNISGTAQAPGSPSDPTLALGTLDVYDGSGNLSPGELIEFRLNEDTIPPGTSYPREPWEAMSSASGRLSAEFRPSSRYQGRRDDGAWVDFTTTGAGTTFTIPAILGLKGVP